MLSIQSEVESELREDLAGLRPEEAAVLAILRVRLGREVSRIKRASAKRRTPGRSRPRVAARRSMPASSAA